MRIRIAGLTKESVVDGPGIRYVVFAQGCAHNCDDCHNKETHDFKGGVEMDIDELLLDIHKRKYIDGVTLSGGDPFYQPKEFAYLTEQLKKDNINVMAYTGFLYEEIIKDDNMKALLKNIDILMDGPFIKEKKTYKMSFRGSSNQRMIDVKKSLESKHPVVCEDSPQ